MGALFIWAPPAGSDGDGADVEPGDVNDFADAAGEDQLAQRESEPASGLLADVAGMSSASLRALSSWAARAGPRHLP